MARPPYLPLDARGWRLAMGLRPLNLDDWLERDERAAHELALKEELLSRHYDEVVATNREGDAASAELLDEIRVATGAVGTGVAGSQSGEHPIVTASRLVQEDLCVLVREDLWRLRAACVCFPSRWRLSEKIGTTLDEIHGPVPGYGDSLASPTNALFDRMTPDKSYWRLNWTLLDRAELHQPTGARDAPVGELRQWYFRVERQTLRQLPATRAVVFTIRTYVTAASELIERDGNFAAALVNAIESAPEEVRAYKGWRGVADRLRGELARGS